jgi:hypothetical protein
MAMRVVLQLLVISGALAVAAGPASALSHSDSITGAEARANSADPGTTPASDASQGNSNPVAPGDVKKALAEIKASWRTYDHCDRAKLCSDYFDSFGVGLTFNDGLIAPFAHTQRLKASAHDCIVNARAALERGDRGMAVQWVMAAEPSNTLRTWFGDHPDAVIEALHHCCF